MAPSKASDDASPVDHNVPLPRFYDTQGRELDPTTGRPLLGGAAGAGSIFHVPSSAPVAGASSKRPLEHDKSEKGNSTKVEMSYADLLAIARRQGFRGTNMIMNIIPYPEDEEQSRSSKREAEPVISSSDQCRVCRTVMAGNERNDGFTLYEIRKTADRGCSTCNALQHAITHFSNILVPDYKDEKVRVIQVGSENLGQLAQAKIVTVRFDDGAGEKFELSFSGNGEQTTSTNPGEHRRY